jgi:transcriptional accessory protein Tex/SPT6
METEALAAPENTGNPELDNIKRKMQFTGTVIKTTIAGAVVDIGLSTPGVVHISQLSTEPVNRVEDVVTTGQQVEVWVKRVFPKKNRIELTMIKPLDLEWREITKGMNLKGKVTRLEKFGAFVEIGAERPGLIHISEMAHGYVRQPSDVVKEGDEVEAQVLDFNRKKKQIKLSIKALQPEPVKEEPSPRMAAFENAPRREKPVRRQRKNRRDSEMGDGSTELIETLEGSGQVEAEPTAMEMAMRAAMEKAKERKAQAEERRKSKVSVAQDELLTRTLENKPRES